MTFREQLLITLVDKAVIGALVVLAGYLLNRALEKFKSERALANEFAKQRLEKIAELWEALYKWEAEVLYCAGAAQKQIFVVRDDEMVKAMEPLLPTLINLTDVRAKEVAGLIDRSRFWLGPALHAHFREHHGIILNHLALLMERPRSTNHNQFVQQLDATRQSIFDHLTAGAPVGPHKAPKSRLSLSSL